MVRSTSSKPANELSSYLASDVKSAKDEHENQIHQQAHEVQSDSRLSSALKSNHLQGGRSEGHRFLGEAEKSEINTQATYRLAHEK